jgi:phage tail-like protein
MAEAHRFDPYRNFTFRVKWEGRYVAGVVKVGVLKRTTEVVEYREAGNPSVTHKMPGRSSFDAITLERGVTHDSDFEEWASRVWDSGEDLTALRRDLVIELVNDAGQVVVAYQVYRAWVSEYQALPDLDDNGSAVVIETLKLENEGWKRDDQVPEP